MLFLPQHMTSGKAYRVCVTAQIHFSHINDFTKSKSTSKYLPEFHQKHSYSHMIYKIPLHSDLPKLIPKANIPVRTDLLLHF